MSSKIKAFYRDNKEISVDFSAGEISSDGTVVLLEKFERKYKIIRDFSKLITDHRDPSKVRHSIGKMLKQRVFMQIQGYEDTNDVHHLKKDPLFKDILRGEMASQPTLSRFENRADKTMIFDFCYAWIDRYVASLEGREEVVIDIDSTDDPTHGSQQLTMFNGFYGQFMYNELFFHDGHTGQIIVPVLRPGNSHSNKWYVAILKRIVCRIRDHYPDMRIIIRADSGFSCAPFYELADKYTLYYAIGLASNEVLKRRVARVQKAVRVLYVESQKKHQHFFCFEYAARSWHKKQTCYAKVESTGIGLNTRFIVSNLEHKDAREIYFDFYVMRGEASENRIKEVKNMCFSDRLSCHDFWAFFFRLFISCLCYEFFRLLKTAIRKTPFKKAWTWQVDTIRQKLLKIGGALKKTKRRVYYRLSSAFVYRDLLEHLLRV